MLFTTTNLQAILGFTTTLLLLTNPVHSAPAALSSVGTSSQLPPVIKTLLSTPHPNATAAEFLSAYNTFRQALGLLPDTADTTAAGNNKLITKRDTFCSNLPYVWEDQRHLGNHAINDDCWVIANNIVNGGMSQI
ncbi:hypothetical protein B0T21DRAFT_361587 [Apiosordaria backusii]|uniref:Uncharacterized protein n=1 Tax=Apiosordaria backusii TaxID=314023 RepID=A0AA40ENE2_9PEZI|nr:hypothetical protein B0T21DRAFT_361587 [Apiosordaria backusii]